MQTIEQKQRQAERKAERKELEKARIEREAELKLQGLEFVFSENHQLRDRIFYDFREGKYYDRSSDIFLENDDLKRFGL